MSHTLNFYWFLQKFFLKSWHPPALPPHFSTALYTCVNINIFEENWVNLKCVNPVNTAAFEIELHVFKQTFQENTSHFDDIESFILKETPPETRETLLLFPNLMTTIQLLHLIQLQDLFSLARKSKNLVDSNNNTIKV